jgi:hypothetical protein
VGTSQQNTLTLWKRGFGIFECHLSRKKAGKKGTSGISISVIRLQPVTFFSDDCMNTRVYHCSKPETRQQLVACIMKAAAGVRNEMLHIQ